MYQWEKHLNAILAIMISFIILGAFAIQYFEDETPCPLCYLQRLAMFGVAGGALMNVRLGFHKAHYGFSLIFATFGSFIALRQISLHICPGFPTFGKPFLGLSLYTWSLVTFVSSIVYIAIVLLIFDRNKTTNDKSKFPLFEGFAFWLTLAVAVANIVTSAYQCGLFGPCEG